MCIDTAGFGFVLGQAGGLGLRFWRSMIDTVRSNEPETSAGCHPYSSLAPSGAPALISACTKGDGGQDTMSGSATRGGRIGHREGTGHKTRGQGTWHMAHGQGRVFPS